MNNQNFRKFADIVEAVGGGENPFFGNEGSGADFATGWMRDSN